MLHCCQISQEWPLVREVSVSYSAPSLRPPDLPTQKAPRPNLLYRIARRLKNYWNPPVEGSADWYLNHRMTTQRWTPNSEILRNLPCTLVYVFRAPKSRRARGVEGAAAVDDRAACPNTQQKPCGEGQSKNNCIYKTLYTQLKADMIWRFEFCILQRVTDSLMICAEPDDFTVGEFITVGLVVSLASTHNIKDHVYVNWSQRMEMFFIIGLKKKRTPLCSLKPPQNWKPVLADYSCQRSETLLSDLILLCHVRSNQNYFWTMLMFVSVLP